MIDCRNRSGTHSPSVSQSLDSASACGLHLGGSLPRLVKILRISALPNGKFYFSPLRGAKKRTATPKPGCVRLTFLCSFESRARSRDISAFFIYSIAKNWQCVKSPRFLAESTKTGGGFWEGAQKRTAAPCSVRQPSVYCAKCADHSSTGASMISAQ